MRLIGIEALYPKKKFINKKVKKEYKYPYLLQNIQIDKPNKVWATDITYIKTPAGFVYLSALIDIFSRFVVSWKISISMHTENSIEVLNKGIKVHTKPEILNSDQGSQFTSLDWTNKLKKEDIQISMDGKRRWADNIFIERFWRTVKQEEIYINPYDNLEELRTRVDKFVNFYNYQRPHQSLDYMTPSQIYYEDINKRKVIKF
jgi:putative transposase